MPIVTFSPGPDLSAHIWPKLTFKLQGGSWTPTLTTSKQNTNTGSQEDVHFFYLTHMFQVVTLSDNADPHPKDKVTSVNLQWLLISSREQENKKVPLKLTESRWDLHKSFSLISQGQLSQTSAPKSLSIQFQPHCRAPCLLKHI